MSDTFRKLEEKIKKPIPKAELPAMKYHSEFSFIALALGLFGLILPTFSILAIIFGMGGLMQTHREHMKGRGLAILGIILGFCGLLLMLAAIIFHLEFMQQLFSWDNFL